MTIWNESQWHKILLGPPTLILRYHWRVDEVNSREPARKTVKEHQRLLALAHVRVYMSEGGALGDANNANPEYLQIFWSKQIRGNSVERDKMT